MSSPNENESQGIPLVWVVLIPGLSLFIIAMCVFMWQATGTETEKVLDNWSNDFVPGESAESTGSLGR